MIPIRYRLTEQRVVSALQAYEDFLAGFKRNLDNAIKRGYVGKRNSDKSGNDTTQYFSRYDRKVFLLIQRRFDDITHMEARYMPMFIRYMKDIYGISSKSPINELISQMFVDNGFDGGNFPKDTLVDALGVDVCPYCNRKNVGLVPLEKSENGAIVIKNLKGQLDHFYSKSLYPYLAISRCNLVPSCSDCNESPNKYQEDAYATSLVSPYIENSPDNFLFRIDVPDELYGNRVSKDQISIVVDLHKKPGYERNNYVFSIDQIYNRFHKSDAVRVYNGFVSTHNTIYQDGVDEMAEGLPNQENAQYVNYKEDLGVVNDKREYEIEILSKLKTDIWEQLERGD